MKKIAKLILALGLIAGLVGCKSSADEPTNKNVKEITITKPAASNTVYQYLKPDTTGLEIKVTYEDDSTKVLGATEYTVECNSDDVNTTIATVKYGGKSVTYEVEVVSLLGIDIDTDPEKLNYYIGEELDLTGIVLKLYYYDGYNTLFSDISKITAKGFNSNVVQDNQQVTVKFNERPVFMYVNIIYNWYDTPKFQSAGTNGTYGTDATYVYFGVWPQHIVSITDADNLGLDASTTKITRGGMEFVAGNDGNYYVKSMVTKNEISKTTTYIDETDITASERWFKVEPIKWCVVDANYKDAKGNEKGKLLVAENILTSNVPFLFSTISREISDENIKDNDYDYSQIRAYLNGTSYRYGYKSGTGTATGKKTDYVDKGFLQTAFGETGASNILEVLVDNSDASLRDRYGEMLTASHDDDDDNYENTSDQIFLLSVLEISKTCKEHYDEASVKRQRFSTDFARANNLLCSKDDGYGNWLLRSPGIFSKDISVIVSSDEIGFSNIDHNGLGIVPALCIASN